MTAVDAASMTVPFPVTFASKVFVDPATTPRGCWPGASLSTPSSPPRAMRLYRAERWPHRPPRRPEAVPWNPPGAGGVQEV